MPPTTRRSRARLNVYEKVNRDIPFNGLHWLFDHCETIDDRNIERIAKLGGGIAIQHRMAYQGEYFVERYGAQKAERTPPIRRMLETGVPVGAGTDATRVASYNPWVSLSWLVTGRTVGGMRTLSGGQPARSRDRAAALDRVQYLVFHRARQEGSDQGTDSSRISPCYPTTISRFPPRESRTLHLCLTLVGGKVVYGDGDFKDLAPPLPPAMPDWSPVRTFGGYQKRSADAQRHRKYAFAATCGCGAACGVHGHAHAWGLSVPTDDRSFWGALGCSCWAV